MLDRTTILIIDHTENNVLKERLEKKPNFEVIDCTNNVDIGFTLAERYQPVVILLNVDLPDNNGFAIAEVFAQDFPASSLILLTGSDNQDVLRLALHIGAKDVLTLPLEDNRLFQVINRVAQQEIRRRHTFTSKKNNKPQFKTITVFGTKGGVGRTTVALNLAIGIRQITKKRVALVDLDLMSSNASLMAGINHKYTMKDLVDEINTVDEEILDSYCTTHSSGLKILPAPINPELAGFIKAEHVEKVLELMSQIFNYVVVDTPPYFHDTTIPALEHAQEIVVVTTMDLASIQNLKQCMSILASLSMQSKARVIVNRMGYSGGLKIKDLEKELGIPIQCVIPNCEKSAIDAVNLGNPLILSAKSSPAAQEIKDLALNIVAENDKPQPKMGGFGILARR